MKNKILLVCIFCFFTVLNSFGQTIYLALDTFQLEIGLGAHFDENGKQGIWEYYADNNPNNQLIFRVNYKDDKLNGEFTAFWLNGKIKALIYFSDSQKEGDAYYYDNKGRQKYKLHYKNNLLDGEQVFFYKSGRIATKAHFKEELMHGMSYAFEDKKKHTLIAEGEFKHGVRDGAYTHYSKNMRAVEFFKNGLPSANKVFYFKGEKVSELILDREKIAYVSAVSYKNGKEVGESPIPENSIFARNFHYGYFITFPKNFR